MTRLSVQMAFLVARLVFAAAMKQALDDRDRRGVPERAESCLVTEEKPTVRLGQYVMVAWLFAVWSISSELVWIVIGRDPWWSAKRVSLPGRARIFG